MKCVIRNSSTSPIILSASKYFKWIFQLSASFNQCPNIRDTFLGDKMHSSPLEVGRKRVELNVCESFKYFTKELWRKYLKKIFAILKVRFHHEGGLSESHRAFLLNLLWSPSTQKISFHWAPLLAFSNVWLNIFKFCC